MNKQFLDDVNAGLSANQKYLYSKYFYDQAGDALFVKIMNAPEYYLTNAEHNIFKNQTAELIKAFDVKNKPFELIELGAGDGTKTLELLKYLQGNFEFTYLPIDISENALTKLKNRLNREVPEVNVITQQGEYFQVLNKLKAINETKIILFLGSNLGNMLDENARKFIKQLADAMNANDKLLIGVDLIKSAEIVLPAYNDKAGYTRDFNLNLLKRINKEFGADFNVVNFKHTPEYIEEEGIARSFLTSVVNQQVHIKAINKTFQFNKGERIHMEISRKYNDAILSNIFKDTGLKQTMVFKDAKNYFADYLFEKQDEL